MRLPQSLENFKNAPGARPQRRMLVRRVLGLTLLLAGLGMLWSGIETVFLR